MAEYIEREALMNALDDCSSWDKKQLASILDELPAADVSLVIHSRFVDMAGFPACENCGASPAVWEPKPDNPRGFPLHCYVCGAKMDLEGD